MLPPGGLLEIVFSFDTTGSMSSCINEVKNHIQDMVKRLQADIPAIRIAIFAHGDYCDVSTYVTKHIDFTTDVTKLTNFVQETTGTGGGDTDECYELVLRQVRETLSWSPGSKRSLIMIGDAPPHEPSYAQNKDNIDWREETEALANMGVKIYATQCQNMKSAENFYKTIAKKTGGHHLRLQEFSNVFDFLMAVAYREHGDDDLFQVYEKEVRSRCTTGLNKDLNDLFSTLRSDGDISTPAIKRKHSPSKSPCAKKTKISKLSMTSTDIKKPGLAKSSLIIKKRKKIIKNKYPLLRREMVPENNFYLNDQKWSPWQCIVTNDNAVEMDEDWKKRGTYFLKKTIFENESNKPAIFEFSVQTKPRTKRRVVYNKMAHRVSGKWERRLFGKSDIRKQVENVANQGCSVFIRRLTLRSDSMKRMVVQGLRKYDYSWKRIRNERINHRKVEICSKLISDDSL